MNRTSLHIGLSGAAYGFVAFVMLSSAVVTQANLLFWCFGLMVGGVLASVALPCLMVRGLEVRRLPPEPGVAGQWGALRYRVTNRRRRLPAFNVVLHEAWGDGWGDREPFHRRYFGGRRGPLAEEPPRLAGRPHAWLAHLGAGQSAEIEAPYLPLKRGRLELQRVMISCSFPFGVVRRIVALQQPQVVVVLPEARRLRREVSPRLANGLEMGRYQQQKPGGHDEFFGLRPYRAGDGLRVVDWKHSARMPHLISRELSHATPPQVELTLDLTGLPPHGPLREERIENAVTLAASVACEAHLMGHQVGLSVRGGHGERLNPGHGPAHRQKLLELLALVEPGEGAVGRAAEGRAARRSSVVVHVGEPGPRDDDRGARFSAAKLSDYLVPEFEPDAGPARGAA